MTDEERVALRKNIIRSRNALSKAEISEKSHLIFEKLLHNPHFINSKVIASYASFKGEVSTLKINEHILALKDQKQLALPVVHPTKQGAMSFYHVKDINDMTTNKYSILEPRPQICPELEPHSFDLVLVPLVAFNLYGVRLGMGGGYYDRMLKQLDPKCRLIGLAYDFQRADNLTAQSWDMPLHEVITPDNHYTF